jgi:xanthine dehydrogenase accessory factor
VTPAPPYALATVVRVDPPVSSRVGDKAVVTVDGRLDGWVGGACAEPIVVREALAALAEGRPRLVRITPAELATALPAPEGSGEPRGGAPVDRAAGSGKPHERGGLHPPRPPRGGAAVDRAPEPGVVAAVSTCPSGGGLEVFVEPVGVAPRLLVCGRTPVAATLARLAELVGYEVSGLGDADLDGVRADAAGPGDAVVVASMGHYDEEALVAALRTRAGYVGLVASRRRAATVFEALRRRGVADADLARVASPAGLDLGPSTQEEIAVAILAELIRDRHRRATAPAPPQEAVDPVCGMTVAVAEASLTAEHAGQTFWFCSEHCRAAFLRDPTGYLGPAG